MRGGFLPPALLCVSLGLALAFTTRRLLLIGVAACAIVAAIVFVAAPPATWIEPIFVGTWLSVIINPLVALAARRIAAPWFVALAVNAGVWTGAVSSVAGGVADLAVAVPLVFVGLVGLVVVGRGWGVGVRTVSSWLAAVAILATMISLTPTPGYKPDHME